MKKYGIERAVSIIVWCATLIFLMCWFLYIHPFAVFDTDDWTYISGGRTLLPSIHEWNPTRILPEIILPFLGNIAAYLIYPINGNYIDSLSVSCGLAAVVSIFTLCVVIYAFYRKILHLSELNSTILSLMFLAVGFVIYKSQDGMSYFWGAGGVTAFYYYIFPGIINAVTVFLMIFVANNKESIKKPSIVIGILAVLVYLSINSNLFHSIILTSFVSGCALIRVIENVKNHENIKKMLSEIRIAIIIDAAWLISMIFEINGGRSKQIGNSNLDITGTVKSLIHSLHSFNKYWIILSFVIIAIGLIIFCIEKGTATRNIYIAFCISGIVTFAYLILLCAKASKGYITNTPAIWGLLFYIQLLANMAMSRLMRNQHVMGAVPFLLFLLLFSINNNIYKYREGNYAGYRYEIAKRVDEDIISQICEAEKEGKSEVTVYTPYYGDETTDGWPLASYGGGRIAKTLYRHKIINSQMTISFERTVEKNAELNLP